MSEESHEPGSDDGANSPEPTSSDAESSDSGDQSTSEDVSAGDVPPPPDAVAAGDVPPPPSGAPSGDVPPPDEAAAGEVPPPEGAAAGDVPQPPTTAPSSDVPPPEGAAAGDVPPPPSGAPSGDVPPPDAAPAGEVPPPEGVAAGDVPPPPTSAPSGDVPPPEGGAAGDVPPSPEGAAAGEVPATDTAGPGAGDVTPPPLPPLPPGAPSAAAGSAPAWSAPSGPAETGYSAPSSPTAETTPYGAGWGGYAGAAPAGSTPTPGDPNATAPFAGHAVAEEPKKRKKRLGLWLGIGIPLAILIAAGIVAAFLVPAIITDNEAQAAAEEYQSEREDWQATFSEDTLTPYAELTSGELSQSLSEISSAGGTTEDLSSYIDMDQFEATCARVEELAGTTSQFDGVAVPEEPSVEGGERNEEYTKAVDQFAAEKPQYDASQELVAELDSALTDYGNVCAFLLRINELNAAGISNYDAFAELATLDNGETQEYDADGGTWTLTCQSESGCIPFTDMDVRKKAGDAWDAAITTWNSDLATAYVELCPLESLQDQCADVGAMIEDTAAASKAVGDAFRTEDIIARLNDPDTPDGTITPEYDEAFEAYSDAYTGSVPAESDFLGELASEIEAVSTRLSEAIAAVQG